MKINKLKVLSLTLVFLLLLVPAAFAQETDSFDDIDFSEYDLTEEQIESLKVELREAYDSAEEVDREAIIEALEELEIEDVEDFNVENLGQELSLKIKEFKNDEDWTGQGLSAMINGFLDEKIENRKNRDEDEVENEVEDEVKVQNQEQNNNQNQVAQENKNNAKNKDKGKSNNDNKSNKSNNGKGK